MRNQTIPLCNQEFIVRAVADNKVADRNRLIPMGIK